MLLFSLGDKLDNQEVLLDGDCVVFVLYVAIRNLTLGANWCENLCQVEDFL